MSNGLTKECYGRFGSRDACASCELDEYCSEAADIKPINAVEYHDNHSPSISNDEESTTPPQLAGAMLEIADAAARHPDAWNVVVAKIRAGSSKSLAEIAVELGLSSKQAAHYHIMSFCRECPAVFDALLFDRRYQKHKASEYYRKKPRWIDKECRRGGRIIKRAKDSSLYPIEIITRMIAVERKIKSRMKDALRERVEMEQGKLI